MLTEYINAALHKAQYEILPDGEGYFGKIEGLKGGQTRQLLKNVEKN